MNKIKQLEIRKLLKELDFVESDYNYKNEIVSEADANFIRRVNEFLEGQPALKEIFDKKVNKNIDIAFDKKIEEIESIEEYIVESYESIQEDVVVILDTKTIKIKKLYREIVKTTHPDRIKNKKLNELYLRATYFYEKEDLIGVYSVCDELNVDYETDEEDNILIGEKISTLKDRIKFLESTLTWKWYHSDNIADKNGLILDYIRSRISY